MLQDQNVATHSSGLLPLCVCVSWRLLLSGFQGLRAAEVQESQMVTPHAERMSGEPVWIIQRSSATFLSLCGLVSLVLLVLLVITEAQSAAELQ